MLKKYVTPLHYLIMVFWNKIRIHVLFFQVFIFFLHEPITKISFIVIFWLPLILEMGCRQWSGRITYILRCCKM